MRRTHACSVYGPPHPLTPVISIRVGPRRLMWRAITYSTGLALQESGLPIRLPLFGWKATDGSRTRRGRPRFLDAEASNFYIFHTGLALQCPGKSPCIEDIPSFPGRLHRPVNISPLSFANTRYQSNKRITREALIPGPHPWHRWRGKPPLAPEEVRKICSLTTRNEKQVHVCVTNC